jgi:hypothetical protein
VFKTAHKFLVLALIVVASGTVSANEALRDPTRPLGLTGTSYTATEKPLRLQSLLISETRKLAFINGQPVREQDIINNSAGTRVVRIDAEGVILQRGDKRWRLKLNAVDVRQ